MTITVASQACGQAVATQIESGIGSVVMTDAIFNDPHFGDILQSLSRQPSWSDIPIILLCRDGVPAFSGIRQLESIQNVTLLDRPTSSRTLLSSVQAALRARARQYQLRQFEEAQQREARLSTTEVALREADHRKDLFLATLAHDLRNPLAPIRNAAMILASPRLNPQQLQWTQKVIERQVRHRALLLDDLLDIARITQGKADLKKCRVTLTEVVEAAIEAAHPWIYMEEPSKRRVTDRVLAASLLCAWRLTRIRQQPPVDASPDASVLNAE